VVRNKHLCNYRGMK